MKKIVVAAVAAALMLGAAGTANAAPMRVCYNGPSTTGWHLKVWGDSYSTSCPFALNVNKAAVNAGDPYRVSAYSPKRGRYFTLYRTTYRYGGDWLLIRYRGPYGIRVTINAWR
jgi:hypothetical protein